MAKDSSQESRTRTTSRPNDCKGKKLLEEPTAVDEGAGKSTNNSDKGGHSPNTLNCDDAHPIKDHEERKVRKRRDSDERFYQAPGYRRGSTSPLSEALLSHDSSSGDDKKLPKKKIEKPSRKSCPAIMEKEGDEQMPPSNTAPKQKLTPQPQRNLARGTRSSLPPKVEEASPKSAEKTKSADKEELVEEKKQPSASKKPQSSAKRKINLKRSSEPVEQKNPEPAQKEKVPGSAGKTEISGNKEELVDKKPSSVPKKKVTLKRSEKVKSEPVEERRPEPVQKEAPEQKEKVTGNAEKTEFTTKVEVVDTKHSPSKKQQNSPKKKVIRKRSDVTKSEPVKEKNPEPEQKERVAEQKATIEPALSVVDDDSLASIPIPPSADASWEDKFDKGALEDPVSQHQRTYAQRYLEESIGLKNQIPRGGEKVVLPQQVMKDYGQMYNYWQNEAQRQVAQAPSVPANNVITVVNGDVFSATCSLAHCVSEDFTMSSGVAVPFRKRFGHVAELLNQRIKTGGVAVLKNGHRFIYYLVTKEFYLAKPDGTHILWHSLEEMREHAMQNGVGEIAMPKIGCGRDQLQWAEVSEAIQQIFCNTGIKITVYQMEEESIPQRPLIVQHLFNSNIVDSRPPIVRIFLTSCQSCPPEGAAGRLNATFKIWHDLMQKERPLGSHVPLFGGAIVALVVKNEARHPIDYQALHKAAKDLAIMTNAMAIKRLVLEGFTLPGDKVVTFKVVTILRLALVNQYMTLNVAWPEDPPYANLVRSAQQNFNNQQQQPNQGSTLGPGEYDY
ncbi:titin homolog isoform X2 [Neocloeon triangulifer]|uniref:titin homolog isoform X2 n=1 Tax=Neocloeon triangulifer TaxID=2078957 RepID=UPI00286F9DBB|nr:titin homolog isoform X2 [Neocloeon triangulifer]